MRMTRLLANTLRETPSEAEVVSHQLLMRAGYIRRLASGIYNYLPLMQRVIAKVSQIVREEMDRSGAQELLMPILQPADIWLESGRWEVYGKELMRFKDRHDRDVVLGPTHEEVITTIAKQELRSYRQLPCNLYQIQNKYRDEIRPRFGLLRGREFIMKDAYSFHASWDDLDKEYEVMTQTYQRIFERCGLETRMVQSDSGAIGGSVSHEFMVLTRIAEGEQESGENDVFYCTHCDYAANSNRAESLLPDESSQDELLPLTEKSTPRASTIQQLEQDYQLPAKTILKALIYILDESTPVMALLRGDDEIEDVKLLNLCQGHEIRLATAEEIHRFTGGASKGFVGPARLPQPMRIVGDQRVKSLKNFAMACNVVDIHLVNANWVRDIDLPSCIGDIRLVKTGEGCPACSSGTLEMTRGIEVGNIFKLGTKYSEKMEATYTDIDGTEKPFIMGCYGIGVSRTAAAAIERFHDRNGIVWPMALAPFQVVIVVANMGDEVQKSLAEEVYQSLQAAEVEVLLDDRDERAGVKFKDADLMGFPIRVTVGKKAGEGLLEVKVRDSQTPELLTPEALPAYLEHARKHWKPFQAMASV